jgi:uncharacterized protein YjbJ (UPF0337 family)
MGTREKLDANADKLKGKAKETVGKIAHDDRLVAEGKADQAKGRIKEGVEKIRDSL